MKKSESEQTSNAMKRGLATLTTAYDYALDLGCERWDLAVEVQVLLNDGLSYTDLRWLCCKGFVEAAREVGLPGDHHREFGRTGRLTVTSETCYVLTKTGAEFAAAIRRKNAPEPEQPSEPFRDHGQRIDDVDDGQQTAVQRPKWDRDRHQLWVGDRLVKCFKLPSPNQETVLTTFEEDGWPPRIDDPLPPAGEIDPKRRLQDTIKSLNRCQKAGRIRFSGDGTGEGIVWQHNAKHAKPRLPVRTRDVCID